MTHDSRISREHARRAPPPLPVDAAVEAAPLCTNQPARFCTLMAGTILWLLGTAPAVPAQGFGPAAESRRGFWVSGGAGQGFTTLRCAICADERESGGLAGHLRAGGTMSERLLVGGDVSYWRRKDEGILEQARGVAATGYWYPDPRHGYFVKFGLGYTWYRAAEEDIALTARLLSAVSGAGYEMRVNPRMSLVPFVNLMMTAKGDMLREDTRNGGFTATRVADDLGLLSLHVGFGITRH